MRAHGVTLSPSFVSRADQPGELNELLVPAPGNQAPDACRSGPTDPTRLGTSTNDRRESLDLITRARVNLTTR
jgi:hypothetical protein